MYLTVHGTYYKSISILMERCEVEDTGKVRLQTKLKSDCRLREREAEDLDKVILDKCM